MLFDASATIHPCYRPLTTLRPQANMHRQEKSSNTHTGAKGSHASIPNVPIKKKKKTPPHITAITKLQTELEFRVLAQPKDWFVSRMVL